MDSGRRDNGEMPKNVSFLLPHLSLIHGTSPKFKQDSSGVPNGTLFYNNATRKTKTT